MKDFQPPIYNPGPLVIMAYFCGLSPDETVDLCRRTEYDPQTGAFTRYVHHTFFLGGRKIGMVSVASNSGIEHVRREAEQLRKGIDDLALILLPQEEHRALEHGTRLHLLRMYLREYTEFMSRRN